MHLAYYLLQLELAGICFAISAFLRKGSAGIGLGIAAMMYFLNLIANIADVAEFLKYITPFGYCEGAELNLHFPWKHGNTQLLFFSHSGMASRFLPASIFMRHWCITGIF